MPCVSEEQDRRLFPEDIAKLEKEIMAFNIPRQVIVDVDDSEYLSLVHWRWKIMVDEQRPIEEQMCPNCLVRHTTTNAGMNQTSREDMLSTPGDVKFNDFCPTHMRENFKDHEHQITVSGCGESQAGSGGMYATHGRVHYDLHSSFENLGTDFHKSYAHLHLSPPEPKYANFTELYSVTDFARALLRPPPSTREGDARGEEATFIHNNCGSKRGQLVSEIIASNEVGVARYGSCFNNFQGSEKYYPKSFYFGDSEGTRDSTKTILSSLHKFTFSLENTFSRDYFTEKRYQALLAGSVPIVWTNDNSLDFLPDPDSSFLVDPNNINAREIAIQLRTIAANETAYNEFFAWKKRGLRASFVRVLFLSTDFLTCRYCEYAAFKHPQSKTRPNGES